MRWVGNLSKPDIPDEQSTEEWIRIIKDQTIRMGENIRYTVLSSSDVLDPDLSHQLGFVQDLAAKPFDLVPEQASFDLMDCDGLIERLALILNEFFDYLDDQLKNMGVTEYDL